MPRTILHVEAFDHGLTWVLDEPMQRASHALVSGGRVWLVDVVDHDEVMERVAALGEVAAVVQLLDRHNRDSAKVAARLGVPHLRLPGTIPGAPFEVLEVVDVPRWRERALWWPQTSTLVVAETVGTGPMYRSGDVPAGIHLFLRLRPPRAPGRHAPDHLLVGHGPPVHGPAATEALRTAYARSLRDLPATVARLPKLARG